MDEPAPSSSVVPPPPADLIRVAAGTSTPAGRNLTILAYDGGVCWPAGHGPTVFVLSGMELPASVPLLADHRNTLDTLLGQGVPAVVNGRLMVRGKLADVVAAARPAELLADGVKVQASVGVVGLTPPTYLPPGKSGEFNGRTITAGSFGVDVFTRCRLMEVSLVAVAGDPATSVVITAQGTPTVNETVPLTPAAVLSATNPPPPAASVTAAAGGPEHAERERVADIVRFCAGHTEIASRAIREGWTALRAENVALKASYTKAPPTWNPHTTDMTNVGYGVAAREASGVRSITAALLVKAGRGEVAEKRLGADTLNRLGSLRAMSLPELCAASLRLDGRDVPASRGEVIRAAVSTGTFPTALGDAARISLEDAYTATPETWRSFCAIRPAADFRPHQTVRPQFFGNLEPLAKGGLVAHGTAAFENAIRWQISTFARQLQIDRQTIIDDDLGVVGEVMPSLGRAGMRTIADLVYRTLLANPGPFFSVANKNILTGAGSAFGVTAMTAAVKTMRVQRDADGSTLDIQPRVLLVPPELETPARQLLASEVLTRDGSTDQQATANPFSQAVQLVVEPRLSNDTFPGFSASRWFLFAGPVDVPAVVGFLDGQQTPTVETFNLNADINRLAIGMRIFHDFGFSLGDPKAGVSNAGA